MLPGTPHISTWGSFFYTMKSSGRTKIFHLRIFLKISHVNCSTNCSWNPGTAQIFHLGIVFHTRWIFPGTPHFPLWDRYSKMNCSRHTAYFHLRVAFQRLKMFQAQHISPLGRLNSLVRTQQWRSAESDSTEPRNRSETEPSADHAQWRIFQ